MNSQKHDERFDRRTSGRMQVGIGATDGGRSTGALEFTKVGDSSVLSSASIVNDGPLSGYVIWRPAKRLHCRYQLSHGIRIELLSEGE